MGGSKGTSESSSQPSTVWSGQSPYLEAMYKNAFEKMGGTVTPGATGSKGQQVGQDQYSVGQVNPSGDAYNFARGITGGAGQAFGNQAGGGFTDPNLYQNLYGLGSGQVQNQALGGAIQAGLGDINRNFQRNLLPSINTGSAMTNTSGGSRQGIAQGLAISDANRQVGDFVNRMRSENFGQTINSMLGANTQLGGLQQQRNLAQQNAMGQAGQLAGLGASPDMAYWQQQFAPLSAFQSIIGNPAILGGGSQSSSKNVSGGVINK